MFSFPSDKTMTSWIAAFWGLAVFFHIYPAWILDPCYTAWLMTGDAAQHYLGWQFFRFEPWQFPIGQISSYQWPTGTSLVYMDAIPLFAFPLKIISPLLPSQFQYHGIWILVNYVLLGFFSCYLLLEMGVERISAWLGTFFFLYSPIIVWRSASHEALTAHWLLVAALLLYLKPLQQNKTKWLFLLSIALLIHAYIFVMVFLIFIATLFYAILNNIKKNLKISLLLFCLTLLISFVIMWQAGYFVIPLKNTGASGFGDYSMNLLAPFTHFGGSSLFFPPQIIFPQQYEGYNYMGAGVLILLAISTILFFFHPKINWKKSSPLLLAALLLTATSLSNRITLGNKIIFEYPIPDTLSTLSTAFRSSGRFFWPVTYMLLVTVIVIICRFFKQKTARFLLLVALLLQIVDLTPLREGLHMEGQSKPSPLISSEWTNLMQGIDHVAFLPAEYSDDSHIFFADLAAKSHKTFNIGYTARQDNKARNNYQKKLLEDFAAGRISSNTLYIIFSDMQKKAENIPNLELKKVDGYLTGRIYAKSKQ